MQEKPLSIALREVNEGKLRVHQMSTLKHRWTRTPTRPSSLPEHPLPGDHLGKRAASHCPRGVWRHCRVQGLRTLATAARCRPRGHGGANCGRFGVCRRQHLGRVVRPSGAYVGVRRRASGAARQDRPRGRPRLRGACDCRPARSRRQRTCRRPAHQRVTDRALPDCLCARHAHRDVAARRNASQCDHAAQSRRRRRTARCGTVDRT